MAAYKHVKWKGKTNLNELDLSDTKNIVTFASNFKITKVLDIQSLIQI